MGSLLSLLKMQSSAPTDPRDISFTGKTVILTGATSGLGYEAAIKFLSLGVDSLIIGSRSLERGNRVKTELETRTDRPGAVQVWELEMSSFQSVKSFAGRVTTELPRLDVALLNAGLWNKTYVRSGEEWEETVQVNTLSTSLLALLLLPKLRESSTASEPTHLTLVSSKAFVRVPAERLRTDGPLLEYVNDASQFKGPKQYGLSKLLLEYVVKTVAQIVRRDDGTLPVIVNSVCPGFCVSALGRQYNRFYERWFMWLVYKFLARPTEQGSRSLVSATVQGVESQGKCWRNDEYLDESTALTTGSEGKQFQDKAWTEILEVLETQAPEVRSIVDN